jgi:hypothetical protein
MSRCPNCDPYDQVCRVLRLTNHAARGLALAMGELPPGTCDEAGIQLAAAEDALRKAIRLLEEARGPFDAKGDPVVPAVKA